MATPRRDLGAATPHRDLSMATPRRRRPSLPANVELPPQPPQHQQQKRVAQLTPAELQKAKEVFSLHEGQGPIEGRERITNLLLALGTCLPPPFLVSEAEKCDGSAWGRGLPVSSAQRGGT